MSEARLEVGGKHEQQTERWVVGSPGHEADPVGEAGSEQPESRSADSSDCARSVRARDASPALAREPSADGQFEIFITRYPNATMPIDVVHADRDFLRVANRAHRQQCADYRALGAALRQGMGAWWD